MMIDTDDHASMIRRIRDRRISTDPELEQRLRDKLPKVTVSAQVVTRVETMTKKGATDSGDEVVAKGFIERDAFLVTVSNWDFVADKDLCMRSQIVPLLDQISPDPKTAVVLQFLDSNGKPMHHVASDRPKAVMAGGR